MPNPSKHRVAEIWQEVNIYSEKKEKEVWEICSPRLQLFALSSSLRIISAAHKGCKLVRTGSPFAAAVNAFEQTLHLFHCHAFHSAADGFKVARAAALEMHIMQHIAFQIECNLAGTYAVWFELIMQHSPSPLKNGFYLLYADVVKLSSIRFGNQRGTKPIEHKSQNQKRRPSAKNTICLSKCGFIRFTAFCCDDFNSKTTKISKSGQHHMACCPDFFLPQGRRDMLYCNNFCICCKNCFEKRS
jgi:hypothetical protein